MAAACAIVVVPQADGLFRATCTLFPECEAVAPTAEEARQAAEEILERIVRARATASQRNGQRMNPIDVLFRRLRSEGRKAFIPFVTAGDPDLATTPEIVRTLAENGASLIEIGFPYSDPIADGSVIQASYTRALSRGLRLADVFDLVHRLRAMPAIHTRGIPLVAMVSYSLVHRKGAAAFLDQAQSVGLSGAIIPDLPVDEAESVAALAAARDFKLIHLVTPTTPRERAVRIARESTGFLYCVSVTGITGERTKLPANLLGQMAWLRQQTHLPLCVGFGISTPEHVRLLRPVADGIIVGSALVRSLEPAGARPVAEVLGEIAALASSLAEAANPG
jgi:tryptophan synthase alpha chain